jgi:hypothetical protein
MSSDTGADPDVSNPTISCKRMTYHGSCHCGAVAFTAEIDFQTTPSQRCNCSICTKSRTWFVGVASDDVTVIKGEDQLADYSWAPPNKQPLGLHYRFCKTCGIRSFVQGTEKSLGGHFYAVAIAALDDIEGDADQIIQSIKYVDGRQDEYSKQPADTRLM